MANIEKEGDNRKGNVTEEGWSNAFGMQDFSQFEAMFADDAYIIGSSISDPVRGRSEVARSYATASQYYEYCNFTSQADCESPFVEGGKRTFLEWELKTLDGFECIGVTILDKNLNGEIVRCHTTHAPLGEMLMFSTHMAKMCNDGVMKKNYFYHDGIYEEMKEKYPNFKDRL